MNSMVELILAVPKIKKAISYEVAFLCLTNGVMNCALA